MRSAEVVALDTPLGVGPTTAPGASDLVLVAGEYLVLHAGFAQSNGGWLEHPVRSVQQPADLLDRFASLATAEPMAIRNFAATYGVLGLCHHGAPIHHNRLGGDETRCGPGFVDDAFLDAHPGTPADFGDLLEPVAAWKAIARRAAAVISLAHAVRLHQRPDANHFATVFGPESIWTYRDEVVPWTAKQTSVGRMYLATEVSAWLRMGAVGLEAEWPARGAFHLELSGAGLFGALALALARELSDERGLVNCADPACGRLFHPRRSTQRYCEVCGPQAAVRAASRRYAAKKRGRP